MKILLRGYYGFGNFGDDLLLCACYSVVRQKFSHAEISVFANFSEALQDFKGPSGYREYVHRIVGDTLDLVDWRDRRNFDLEVYGGGEVFKSGQRKNFTIARNLLALVLGGPRISMAIAVARRVCGRELGIRSSAALAVGVGVERHSNFSENLLRDMEQLGRLNKIYVRDHVSAASVQRLGLKCEVGSDLAFVLKERIREKRIEQSERKGIGAILCAGKPKTDEILKVLKSKSSVGPVTLIFFDENYDRELIQEAKFEGFNVLVWRPQLMSIDEFLELLSQFALIISNRFHGALTAAMLNIPSIVLETDAKLKSVSEMLPNSVYGFSLSGSIEDLRGTIDNVASDGMFLTPQIDLDIERQHISACRMISAAFGQTND